MDVQSLEFILHYISLGVFMLYFISLYNLYSYYRNRYMTFKWIESRVIIKFQLLVLQSKHS